MKRWLHRLLGMGNAPDLKADMQEVPQPQLGSAVFPATRIMDDALLEPTLHAAVDIDHLYFPWMLGMEASVSEPNDTERRLLRALERISSTDTQAVTALVPRMPAVIPMLLHSLRDKDVSNARLSDQIARDPVLLAALLRQVNSSYYRRNEAITSIEQALALLGQNNLRLLVASVAFKPLFNMQSGHFIAPAAPRLSALSTATAVACRTLATRRQVEPFEAFLATLLQNVGLIVALRIMDQVYEGGDLRSLSFCSSLTTEARRLSLRVGREWQFPPAVLQALAEQDSAAGADSPVSQLLRLADRLSKLHVLVVNGQLAAEEGDEFAAVEGGADGIACYRQLTVREEEA